MMENLNAGICPVCDELTMEQLECRHHLCPKCKDRWFQKQRTCPLCRHIVPHEKGTINILTSSPQSNIHIVNILYDDDENFASDDENTVTYFADTEELRTSIRIAQSFRFQRSRRQRILRQRQQVEWRTWWCSMFRCFPNNV